MAKEKLLFIGHISIDHVKNIWGENLQPGGAALYASLGAKVLYDNVKIISAVGKDFKHLNFIHSTFPGSIIKVVNMPTTFFRIIYDEKFKATYDVVKLGAGAKITIKDLPKHWIKDDVFIHLTPINPLKAKKFVEHIKRISSNVWVSINSSPDYLEKRENRRILRNLMKQVDLMVLNDYEAMALAETDSLIHAVNVLKARRLAVTLGQLGAIMVENGKIQMIPALSGLTVTSKDTTGAGDTWCGSLLAAYIQTKDWMKSVVAACLISAIKCLDWGFEKIKKLRFKNMEEIVLHVLSLSQKNKQLTLEEFLNKTF